MDGLREGKKTKLLSIHAAAVAALLLVQVRPPPAAAALLLLLLLLLLPSGPVLPRVGRWCCCRRRMRWVGSWGMWVGWDSATYGEGARDVGRPEVGSWVVGTVGACKGVKVWAVPSAALVHATCQCSRHRLYPCPLRLPSHPPAKHLPPTGLPSRASLPTCLRGCDAALPHTHSIASPRALPSTTANTRRRI